MGGSSDPHTIYTDASSPVQGVESPNPNLKTYISPCAPSNEPINFDIPGLIFQMKAMKFGTGVGINTLLDISPGSYHNLDIFRFSWFWFVAFFCSGQLRGLPFSDDKLWGRDFTS